MDISVLILLAAGAAGGLTRGLVGYVKHTFAYKKVEFKFFYILIIMLVSSLIGLGVTWSVFYVGLDIPILKQANPALAFIIGYAGGDFIENLYKIMIGKTTLYPLPKE